jgi:hypothetical protein
MVYDGLQTEMKYIKHVGGGMHGQHESTRKLNASPIIAHFTNHILHFWHF